MEKKILLIDENLQENKNFIDVLRTAYEVDPVGYISAARIKLQHSEEYNLVVLDVMMPPLGLFDLIETEDGLKTGLVFYEHDLREKKIPVLFWSWNADFAEEIKDRAKYDSNTSFLLKDNDPNHLLDGVNKFFNNLDK